MLILKHKTKERVIPMNAYALIGKTNNNRRKKSNLNTPNSTISEDQGHSPAFIYLSKPK